MKETRFEKYSLSQISMDDLEDGKIFEINTGEKIMSVLEGNSDFDSCGWNHPLGPCYFHDTNTTTWNEDCLCSKCINSDGKKFFFVDI